jgi:hypothetical protein
MKHPTRLAVTMAAALLPCLGLVSGCGGSGGNPLDNPDSVENPTGSVSGQKLSFAYFQYCVNPIFNTELPIKVNDTISTNKCASSGCHDSVSGTGGAFRLVGAAGAEALTQTPETIRATDMYKNYYSAQGSAVVGSTSLSNLLNKPRVFRVLHAGGLIFLDETDPNVKLIEYWITHPRPKTGDEFSNSDSMFTNGVPRLGECKDQ